MTTQAPVRPTRLRDLPTAALIRRLHEERARTLLPTPLTQQAEAELAARGISHPKAKPARPYGLGG